MPNNFLKDCKCLENVDKQYLLDVLNNTIKEDQSYIDSLDNIGVDIYIENRLPYLKDIKDKINNTPGCI